VARKFLGALAKSALFWLGLVLTPFAVFAGWEFTRWFILEYGVALLVLISLSIWALFRPKRKLAKAADQTRG
jgi:hypothetical protein